MANMLRVANRVACNGTRYNTATPLRVYGNQAISARSYSEVPAEPTNEEKEDVKHISSLKKYNPPIKTGKKGINIVCF